MTYAVGQTVMVHTRPKPFASAPESRRNSPSSARSCDPRGVSVVGKAARSVVTLRGFLSVLDQNVADDD